MAVFPTGDEARAAGRDDTAGGRGAGGGGRGMPRVHTRRQWGAKPPRHRARVLDRAPDHIVVHHTATTNTKDYSKAQAYRLSRIVQRFHMRQLGWDDIGEQLTISRGGYVMEGRNRSLAAIRNGRHVVGAQTLGYNDSTIGIENEGNYSNAPVPVQLWASLVDTCVWLCYAYDLDPFQAIVGHRDFGSTECPGDVLYQRLPELRWVVARRLGVQGERVATPGHGDLHVPNQDSASRTVLRGVPDPPAQPDGMA